jgi:O-antigen ligase
MAKDGLRIWTESPRNIIFGVGMDSVKSNWQAWGMFEGGKLPLGHFHSTPLQLAVERGLPALLIWFALMAIYLSMLWRTIRKEDDSDWRTMGMLLGCLGGEIGFLASSIVHYNFGDQEVAMIFYLLMGLAASVIQRSELEPTQTS